MPSSVSLRGVGERQSEKTCSFDLRFGTKVLGHSLCDDAESEVDLVMHTLDGREHQVRQGNLNAAMDNMSHL